MRNSRTVTALDRHGKIKISGDFNAKVGKYSENVEVRNLNYDFIFFGRNARTFLLDILVYIRRALMNHVEWFLDNGKL